MNEKLEKLPTREEVVRPSETGGWQYVVYFNGKPTVIGHSETEEDARHEAEQA